jgi:hypothetical protein
MEMDYGLHLHIGFASIIALNPEIDYADLSNISGCDVVSIVRVGRGFFGSRSEEESEDGISDALSESTPEPTTPPKASSTKRD